MSQIFFSSEETSEPEVVGFIPISKAYFSKSFEIKKKCSIIKEVDWLIQ